MSGAGALDVSSSMTNAESLLFTLKIIDDVVPSAYEWVYDLAGCQTLHLTEGDGITVNDGIATVIIDPGADYRLAPGTYKHGCITTDKVTGRVQQVFDGEITVTWSPNA